MIADANPNARIALVPPSLAEAWAVMVERESGMLAICWPDHRPRFEPSLHRIRLRNGAQAQWFSAAEPEGLRDPQHSHACMVRRKKNSMSINLLQSSTRLRQERSSLRIPSRLQILSRMRAIPLQAQRRVTDRIEQVTLRSGSAAASIGFD